MADIVEAERRTFDEEVFEPPEPVVVEFVTDWCDTCQELEPVVEELAETHADEIRVVTVDVESEGRLANEYHVADVPTFIAFVRRNSLKRISGDVTADDVEELFDYLVNLPRLVA